MTEPTSTPPERSGDPSAPQDPGTSGSTSDTASTAGATAGSTPSASESDLESTAEPTAAAEAGAVPAAQQPATSQPGSPQAADPQAGSPQPGSPQAGSPQAADPQAGSPQPGSPQPADPQATYPQSGHPYSGYPQAGYPQTGPQAGYPQSGYPQPGYPQAGYPQAGYPQSGPQAGDPQAGYQQPTYPQPGYQPGGYQPGYQQAGYQQPGQPQTVHAQPGYPQPGYAPAGPGGGSFGPPPGPGGPWSQGGPGRFGRRGPIWIGVGVLAVVAVLVAVLVGVTQLGAPDPDEAVSAAVDDLKTWDGITYRGEVTQYSKGNIRVDLTVDRNGDMAGTLMRPNGARAEYAKINGVELFKGEANWWKGDTQETDKVQRLAGIWVSNASLEASGLSNQISGVDKVASDLEPPGLGGVTGFSLYRDGGTRDVAGQKGRVLDGIGRKVIVSQDRDSHLLAVIPLLSEIPLEVARPDPAALGRINERRPIRDTAPDYNKALFEKPNVTAQVLTPPGVCNTPECTATIRLTNTSRFDAEGSVQVTVNGEYADFKTFTLRGGQSQDLQVSARNTAAPGQTVPIRWEAKVSAY